jgi:glycosyltransferase involved in cell wall biosynthesis
VESELMERYADNSTRLAQRWYARRTATLLRRCEDLWLARGDAHTVCSEREQLLLRQRAPQAHITVVGNGVDCAFLGAAPTGLPGEQASRQTVVFVGSMNYHANVDAALYFAAEIWPAVRRLRPELQFVIVGARPVAQIQALHGRDGIVVTGTVPDVRPYYRDALAVVVPLRVGGGTRLKVLEAMAAGTPVISTTLGVEGLAVSAGRELLIADTPAAFTELVAGMHGGDALWQRLRLQARECVRTQYDWAIMGKALLAVHGEAAARRQRSLP